MGNLSVVVKVFFLFLFSFVVVILCYWKLLDLTGYI